MNDEETLTEDTPELEAYEYTFTGEDVKEMVAAALEGKAESYENDAALEDRRGAANITKINFLKWAAVELRALATLIRTVPMTETRMRAVDVAADVEGPAEVVPLEATIQAEGTLSVPSVEYVEVSYLANPPEAGGSTVVAEKRRVRKS